MTKLAYFHPGGNIEKFTKGFKNANPLVACSKDYEAKMNRSVQY